MDTKENKKQELVIEFLNTLQPIVTKGNELELSNKTKFEFILKNIKNSCSTHLKKYIDDVMNVLETIDELKDIQDSIIEIKS